MAPQMSFLQPPKHPSEVIMPGYTNLTNVAYQLQPVLVPVQLVQTAQGAQLQLVQGQAMSYMPVAMQQAAVPQSYYTSTAPPHMTPMPVSASPASPVTSDSETSMSDQDTSSVRSSSSSSRSRSRSPLMAPMGRASAPSRPPSEFNAKYTNHAKGNFYISPENVALMMRLCVERFDTDIANDEKSAFGYYKESVAMQINDGQIRIHETGKGAVVLIDIDLRFNDGQNNEKMYLVAMENASEFVDRVRWCIKEFLTAHEVALQYGIAGRLLPRSSRERRWFQQALRTPPVKVPLSVVDSTDFRRLPAKKSKRRRCQLQGCGCKEFVRAHRYQQHKKHLRCVACGHSPAEHGCGAADVLLPRTHIGQQRLKQWVRRSWHDARAVPVVVIKGKKTWMEWKKFVQVEAGAWVAISLRHNTHTRRWKIECLDYDAGRIWYQHRLVGRVERKHEYSFRELAPLVTTTLEIR